jgi:hypothetical protein
VLAALLAVALVATVLALGTATAPQAGAAELVRVAGCEELTALTSPAAVYGSTDVMVFDPAAGRMDAEAAPEAMPLPGEAQPPAGTGGPAGGTGATNVQVAGVDELDVAEIIDGRVLSTGADGRINLVEPDGTVRTGPVLSSSGTQFAWDGGEVAWAVALTTEPDTHRPVVTLARLGIDDLTIDGTWSAPGRLVGARAVDGQVRLVVVDEPWGRPVDVLPFELNGQPQLPCDEVWRPASATEPGVTDPGSVLVISFDPDRPAEGEALVPTASGQVVGGGEIVYATRDAVYVATGRYHEEGMSTEIHRFDATTMTPTGSGLVPGRLLGQFALDEHQGVLRVASTVETFERGGDIGIPVEPGAAPGAEPAAPDAEVPAAPDDEVVVGMPEPAVPETIATEPVAPEQPAVPETDNLVITLDTQGSLDEIGKLGGLGKPGETIHGIRFHGDIAFVVTFLTTDPFYTVDLSDPAAPRLLGELEIPGFSAYLHPIAPGRVVGIGMSAELQAQAQLFDVSDLRNPRSLDVEVLGDESPAVWDHLAFAALGDGRFAVPVAVGSSAVAMPALPAPLPEPVPAPQPEPAPADPGSTEPGPGAGAGEPGASEPGFPGTEPGATEPDFPGTDDTWVWVEPDPGAVTDGTLVEPDPGAVTDPAAPAPVDPGPGMSVLVADGSGDELWSMLRFDLPHFPQAWSTQVRIAAATDGGYTVVIVGGGVVRVDAAGVVTSTVAFR